MYRKTAILQGENGHPRNHEALQGPFRKLHPTFVPRDRGEKDDPPHEDLAPCSIRRRSANIGSPSPSTWFTFQRSEVPNGSHLNLRRYHSVITQICINRLPSWFPSRLQAVSFGRRRRASAKFAGRQKVHVSNKFGFTKYTKKELPCRVDPHAAPQAHARAR